MRVITGLPFADTQCGFKLYRADAAEAIFSRQVLDGFSFDVEDLYLAQRMGLQVLEAAGGVGERGRNESDGRRYGESIRRSGADQMVRLEGNLRFRQRHRPS